MTYYQEINPRRIQNNCEYICSNIGAPQCLRQILTYMKGKIDTTTVIVGTLTPHINRSAENDETGFE